MPMYQKPMIGDKPSRPIHFRFVLATLTLCMAMVLFVYVHVSAAESASSVRDKPVAADISSWKGLINRLAAEGADKDELHLLFSRMGTGYSADPMGLKLRTSFLKKFSPPKPSVKKDGQVVPSIYPGVMEPKNIDRARVFLEDNRGSLLLMEQRFGVPKEVAVGLVLVETRLGTFLGKELAFRSLACLAATDRMDLVRTQLSGLKMTTARKAWLAKRMKQKATWAFAELQALMLYSAQNDLDPVAMPGSVYGAVGICQFMPSNILRFGVDGDGDGKVNLFNVQDALHSLANYLRYHGWKPGLSRASQQRVLRHYNNSNMYANTILAVADALR